MISSVIAAERLVFRGSTTSTCLLLFVFHVITNLHWNCVVAKVTSYVQKCLFKCFIVYLLSYCLKIFGEKLLDYSYIQKFAYQMGHAPFYVINTYHYWKLQNPLRRILITMHKQTPLSSYYAIRKHHNVLGYIIMWCWKPVTMLETTRGLWGQPYWEAMSTIKKDQS